MYHKEINHDYHIFPCRSPGCHEIIPVESFISSTISSISMAYLQHEGVGLSQDLVAVDVTCPYCRHTNHFHMKDRIRSISRKEYQELSNTVLSKVSLVRVVYRILQSTHGI